MCIFLTLGRCLNDEAYQRASGLFVTLFETYVQNIAINKLTG